MCTHIAHRTVTQLIQTVRTWEAIRRTLLSESSEGFELAGKSIMRRMTPASEQFQRDIMNWSENRTLQQLLLGGSVLVVGGTIAVALILTRATPPKEERPVISPLVEVIRAERQDVQVTVEGHGIVQSTVRTKIVPEVNGRVVSVHRQMFGGGFIPRGKPLLVIDSSDYELAVEERRSQLQQSQAVLETVEAMLTEAKANLRESTRELERVEELYEKGVVSSRDVDRTDTAWRVAQARLQRETAELQTAHSRVEVARVALRRAALDLSRTRISLPFDAVVLSEAVDVGQYVVAGQSVAEVYGTSAVEISVPLENEQLKWLPSLPVAGRRSDQERTLPQAEVSVRLAGRVCRWMGQAVRTEGQIDPHSRMVGVVIRVEDPLHGLSADQPPLLPGTFVEVTIFGSSLRDVIPLPRYAVHNEDEIWVVNDGQLQVQKIEIAHRQRDLLYVKEGLQEGQRVIVSPMDVVTDGMQVSVVEQRMLGVSSSSGQSGNGDASNQKEGQ